jgi:hypothetical protein
VEQASAEEQAAARQAVTMWLEAVWRNDMNAACPNWLRPPGGPPPPLGGCSSLMANMSEALNPPGVPLESMELKQLEVTGNKAAFTSEDVVVNGRSLGDFVSMNATSGRVRYEFSFVRTGLLWYYEKSGSNWKF